MKKSIGIILGLSVLVLYSSFFVITVRAQQDKEKPVTLFENISFSGSPRNVVKINEDGSVDAHFPPGWKFQNLSIDYEHKQISGQQQPTMLWNYSPGFQTLPGTIPCTGTNCGSSIPPGSSQCIPMTNGTGNFCW